MTTGIYSRFEVGPASSLTSTTEKWNARPVLRESGPPKGLTRALASRLAIRILRGEYAPGDYLPIEMDNSAKLGISRSAYREAIRILVSKGLLDCRPKVGTQICPRSRWNILDPDMLQWTFETEPSEAFVQALFELRLITEPAVAELAAQRRTDADVAQMRASLDVMRRETLMRDSGRAADLEFHRTLVSSARNLFIASMSSTIEAAVSWSTLYKARRYRLNRDPVPDHEQVLDAIANRDSGAARWSMGLLIRKAHDDLLASEPTSSNSTGQL